MSHCAPDSGSSTRCRRNRPVLNDTDSTSRSWGLRENLHEEGWVDASGSCAILGAGLMNALRVNYRATHGMLSPWRTATDRQNRPGASGNMAGQHPAESKQKSHDEQPWRWRMVHHQRGNFGDFPSADGSVRAMPKLKQNPR